MAAELTGEIQPKLSIIIPMYNRMDLTHQRLMEIYKFAPQEVEIIVIDDCSTEPDVKGTLGWWQKDGARHPLRYYRNPENLGFGGSLNNGAKLAKGNLLVFLSNDVILYGDIFSEIETLIGQDDTMLVAGRIVDFPGGWNEFDIDGDHLVVPYAEGWLLACTRGAWKMLGGFDPRYSKFDYEDVDLSTRAMELGMSLVALNSPMLLHLSGQTIATLGVDRPAITTGNRKIYLEKWGFTLRGILEKGYGT